MSGDSEIKDKDVETRARDLIEQMMTSKYHDLRKMYDTITFCQRRSDTHVASRIITNRDGLVKGIGLRDVFSIYGVNTDCYETLCCGRYRGRSES